jgi:WD40 repeat protein
LKLWNLETGELQGSFTGHDSWINTVAIASHGKRFISGSRDRTVKLWDLKTQDLLATFRLESEVISCAIAPDGRKIVVGDAGGKIYFLSLEGIN